jgi:hypothetical protein
MTFQTALSVFSSTDTDGSNRNPPGSTQPWFGSHRRCDPEMPAAFNRGERRLDTSMDGPKATPTLPLLRSTDAGILRGAPSVELLAEWNGCVTSVKTAGHYFSATLKGVIGLGVKGEEEDATIPIADVSESDKDLLRPGNFFRLCITCEILPTGQPRRYTQVVFRRLPAYRQHDLDQAAERGRELARGLRVE